MILHGIYTFANFRGVSVCVNNHVFFISNALLIMHDTLNCNPAIGVLTINNYDAIRFTCKLYEVKKLLMSSTSAWSF